MHVLTIRNAHEGFPKGLKLLKQEGIRRQSRNGPVIQVPTPVSIVYKKPWEKVIFWPQREANPFFHLYESLWLLDGRRDVAPLERYVKNLINYSDDGVILHGAYGYRWRYHFGFDQLQHIIKMLQEKPDERRGVLQMWDANIDGRGIGKDYPCNTLATFQRGIKGELNLVVFCRSNDAIWGTFGANAVQFGTLLEYMSLAIGCKTGTYTQISVNFHAYDNEVWKQVSSICPDKTNFVNNPYLDRVHHTSMEGSIQHVDNFIKFILQEADNGFQDTLMSFEYQWEYNIAAVLIAHHLFKINTGEKRYTAPLALLLSGNQKADWIVAAREWLERRQMKAVLAGEMSHP